MKRSTSNEFPAAELRRIMAQRGKTLDFIQEEIEDLADIRLGDRRILLLLTMLFPHLDSRDGSDIDHVFPKSRFTPTRLKGAQVEEELVDQFRDRSDWLANLQLLDRSVNNEKPFRILCAALARITLLAPGKSLDEPMGVRGWCSGPEHLGGYTVGIGQAGIGDGY